MDVAGWLRSLGLDICAEVEPQVVGPGLLQQAAGWCYVVAEHVCGKIILDSLIDMKTRLPEGQVRFF